jgi:hypothetical protein
LKGIAMINLDDSRRPRSEAEMTAHILDDRFDPIEAGLRDRVREFIQAMIESEPEVLLGVVPPPVHVFEAPLGGDRLGGLEPRAGVRDETNPGEDLIRLDHDLVGASANPLISSRSRRPTPQRNFNLLSRTIARDRIRSPGKFTPLDRAWVYQVKL